MRRALLILILLLATPLPSALAQPLPDFRLTDVSISSVRGGSPVSPRDYILQVSGYYFGAAT